MRRLYGRVQDGCTSFIACTVTGQIAECAAMPRAGKPHALLGNWSAPTSSIVDTSVQHTACWCVYHMNWSAVIKPT